MKEYKYEWWLSGESFKSYSGTPLLQEKLSPRSTGITPFQEIHLKILSKTCRRVTALVWMKAVQVFTVCILACLSDYQDYY